MEITSETKETIDNLITDEMAKLGTVGTSLGIIYQDKLIYTKSYGAMNFEKRKSPNENTLFNIASVTKSFVCLAILLLVEEGKLSLEDPINRYLPIKLGKKDAPIRRGNSHQPVEFFRFTE